jgi:hypothetical protein
LHNVIYLGTLKCHALYGIQNRKEGVAATGFRLEILIPLVNDDRIDRLSHHSNTSNRPLPSCLAPLSYSFRANTARNLFTPNSGSMLTRTAHINCPSAVISPPFFPLLNGHAEWTWIGTSYITAPGSIMITSAPKIPSAHHRRTKHLAHLPPEFPLHITGGQHA